jgi:8-oxo-dGTP pyrophosphatase MutT (NUDIX family)
LRLPYRILSRSFLKKDSLTVAWSLSRQDTPKELARAQECYWQTLNNKSFYNGKLVCLDQWSEENGLNLLLGVTDYKSLLYSNAYTDEIVHKWGKEYISRALGVSAVVVSRDNYSFVLLNSTNVGEYPGYWDVPGGHVDFPVDDQIPDPFESMYKELQEELALTFAVENLYCMGLIETRHTLKPELLFMAICEYCRQDVLDKAEHALDRFEFNDLLALSVDDVAEWLVKNINRISPSALAALQFFSDHVRRVS